MKQTLLAVAVVAALSSACAPSARVRPVAQGKAPRKAAVSRPLALKPAAATELAQKTLASRACDLEQLPAPLPRSRRRHAMVIAGAGSPAGDARLVRAYLTRRGFPDQNVSLLSGGAATTEAVAERLERWLPARVDRKDEVFVYLAGDGAFDRAGEPKLRLADGELSLRGAYAALVRLPVESVTVVLDAPAKGAWTPAAAVSALRAPAKLRVLTAAPGDPARYECGGAHHGFVTYFWLKGLKGAGR